MARPPKFSLLDYLEKNAPVVCDGSKPLLLQNLGFPETEASFIANITHPELVSQTYKQYLQSGAAILRTNTEGAHRLVLESLGLIDRGENINNNGMALLREGAGIAGIPAGSITSVHKDVSGKIPNHLLEKSYGEQLIYQSDTGVLFFMLSEFTDFEDLKLAARVAKRSTPKQVVAHLRFQNDDPRDFLGKLAEVQQISDFIGIQASWQEAHLTELVQSSVDQFGIVSLLLDEPAPLHFGEISSAFTETLSKLLPLEPAMIGGGRGTTPAHIRSIADGVNKLFA
ncbi:MAG: homocysteine S-methyltransferase family protein [SAR324 cluster bacterium]|nr:homocysteine S-methyltransferase family protein [SAR324 cluster bacterium]